MAEAVLPVVRSRYPQAEVVLSPLSLTSGAHMGPGTWGVAFLPAGPDPANDSRAAGYRPGGAEADRHART